MRLACLFYCSQCKRVEAASILRTTSTTLPTSSSGILLAFPTPTHFASYQDLHFGLWRESCSARAPAPPCAPPVFLLHHLCTLCTHGRRTFVGFWPGVRDNGDGGASSSYIMAKADEAPPNHPKAACPAFPPVPPPVVHINKCHSNAA